MRLAFVGTRGLPGQLGGYERVAEEIGSRLVQRGHSVTVYCERGRAEDPTLRSHKGMDLIHLPHLSGKALEAPSFDIVSLLHVAAKRGDFDLIYLMGYSMAWVGLLPRALGVPMMVNTDGLEWKRAKWGGFARAYLKASERIAARVASGLAADSFAVADHFRESYGRESYYVGNGADVELASPDDAEVLQQHGVSPKSYATVVSRIEPENNVDLMIRGYVEAEEVDWPLLVIGGAHYDSPYVKEIRKLESDRVRFTGVIKDKRTLMALRSNAVMYLHGHEVGGTNPSLLESMGCGNAVIATDNPFNGEVLGDTGILVEKSTAAVADAVRRLWTSNGLAAELGAAAQRRQQELYSWERSTELHEQAFEALLAGRPPEPR